MTRLGLLVLVLIALWVISVSAQASGGGVAYFLVVPPQFLTISTYNPPAKPPPPDRTWSIVGSFATLQQCQDAVPNLKVHVFEAGQQVIKTVPSDAACVPLSFLRPESGGGS
jgi:hypothetical protein